MIARRSLLIVLNNVVGALLGFFALLYITKFPEGAYGSYTWAASALGIAALLSNLGFPQAHIKRLSELVDERAANGTFFFIKTALTLIFVGAVLLAFALWTRVLGKGFTDSTTEPVFYAVLVAYVALSFRQFFDATFQAHRHTARGESVLLVDSIVSLIGVALAYHLIRDSYGYDVPWPDVVHGVRLLLGIDGPVTPEGAGLLIAAAYLSGRMVSLLYAAFQFFAHRYPMGRPDRALFASYREFGIPIAIAAALTALYANIDRVFLGIFWDKTNVENFQVPYQILTPMLLASVAVGSLLFPSISRLQAEGDLDAVGVQTRRAERYLTMLLMPQMALALVFAREGINIFDQHYVESANVLRILVFFVFFNVLVSPTRSLLLGTGNPKVLQRIGIINVLVVVGLNLLFIPPQALGMRETGAAIVAALGSLVGYAFIKHHARAFTGPDYLTPGFLRQAAAATILGGLLWLAREELGVAYFTRYWQLGLTAIVAIGVYWLLLILLREFRREDWDFVRDLMHPGKMADYVGRELTGRTKQP